MAKTDATITYATITEPCGAEWYATATELPASNERAFFVQRNPKSARSVAMPEIFGFYALSIGAALNRLND